jgi:hypothetical protein
MAIGVKKEEVPPIHVRLLSQEIMGPGDGAEDERRVPMGGDQNVTYNLSAANAPAGFNDLTRQPGPPSFRSTTRSVRLVETTVVAIVSRGTLGEVVL